MKRYRLLIASMWQPALVYVMAFALICALLWYRLHTIVPAAALSEVVAKADASRITDIVRDPLYAPHKLLQLILISTGHDGVLAMRFVSTIFGAAVIALFFKILRYSYPLRIVTLGTAMFVTSSWLLHAARLASPQIMLALLIGLLWCGMVLRLHNRKPWHIGACMVLLVALCYVPGMIWFVVPGIIWQRNALIQEMNQSPFWSGVFGGAAMLLLLPLAWGMFQDPGLINAWLGAPQTLPSFSEIGRNILDIPKAIFWSGLADNDRWLPGTPLIDAFTTGMVMLGGYSLYKQRSLDRVKFIFAVLLLGIAFVGVQGPVTIVYFLPFVYLIATSGLAFMTQQWVSVFPRNPLAQNIGSALLVGAVGVSIFYQLTHYYVAWPNTPATKEAFSTRL